MARRKDIYTNRTRTEIKIPKKSPKMAYKFAYVIFLLYLCAVI